MHIRHTLVLVVALTSGFGAAPARADLALVAGGEVESTVVATGNYAPGCTYYTPGAASGSCSFSTFLPGNAAGTVGVSINGSVASSATSGGLMNASAAMTLSILSPATPQTVGFVRPETQADAGYRDDIHVTSAAPTSGYIVLTLATSNAAGGAADADGYLAVNQGVGCTTNASSVCTVRQLVDFTAPIAVRADLEVFAPASVGPCGSSGCFGQTFVHSMANVSSQVGLATLGFTDLAGNALALAYVTDGGLSFTSPAPEPGTLALFAAGLVGLTATTRRRRELIAACRTTSRSPCAAPRRRPNAAGGSNAKPTSSPT